jgi:chaperonin GroEL
VGAATEVELKEKKHRIEDAVSATKAAVEEGIVAGGGVALLRVEASLDKLDLSGDEATGARIVRDSSADPARLIAENAGYEGAVVVEHIRSEGDTRGLQRGDGRVPSTCSRRASSTRPRSPARRCRTRRRSPAIILTTESAVVEKPEDEDDSEMAGAGHGGHMH